MASRSQLKLRAEFEREVSQRSPEDRTIGFKERRRFNPIASALPCCCLGHPRIIEDEEDHLRPRRATPSTARRPPKDGSWVVEEGSETELNFPPLNDGEDGFQAIHKLPQEFRLGEKIPAEGGSPVCVITAKNWSNLTGSGARLPSSSRVRKSKSSKSGRKGVACARITEVPESEDLSALEKSKTSRTSRARKWFRGFLKRGRRKVLQLPQPWSGVEEQGAGENSWNQNRVYSQQGVDDYDRLSSTSSVITDDFEEYISLGKTSDEVLDSEEVHGSGNCEDLGRGRRPGRDKGVLPVSTGRGRKSSCLRQSDGNGLANSSKNQKRPSDVKKTIANEDAKSSPSDDHCTDQEPYCPPCVYNTPTGAKVILIHVQPVRNQPCDGMAEFRGFGPPVKPKSPCRAISGNKHENSKTPSKLGGVEMKNGISVTTKTNREIDSAPEATARGVKKAINQVQEIKTTQIREELASKVPKLPAIQGDRKPSSKPQELIGSGHKEEGELTERQREDEAQKKRNLEILGRIRERSKLLGSQPPPPAPARPVRSSPRPPAKVASLPVTMTETTVSEPGKVKELYEENCRNTQMMMNRLMQGQGFGGHVPGKQSRPSLGKNGSSMQQQSDIFSCCQQMLESNGKFQEENRKAMISTNMKWIEMKQQKEIMFAANHGPCPDGASMGGHPFHHKEREGPGIRVVNDPTLEGEDVVHYRGRFIRFCWPHPKDTVKRTQMARRKHGKKRITVESAVKLPKIVEEPVDNRMIQTNLKQKCQEGTGPSREGYHRGVELAAGIVDQNYPGTPYPKPTPANQLAWAHGTRSGPRRRNSRGKNTKKLAGLRKYHTAIEASKSGMPGPDEIVDFNHREEDGVELIEL